MTEWLARRVKDQMMCGRTTDGVNQRCRGVIIDITTTRKLKPLPPGMTEDPPGSHHWRYTMKAKRQIGEGRKPLGHGTGGAVGALPVWNEPRHLAAFVIPELPFTRECPECKQLARVTADLLQS